MNENALRDGMELMIDLLKSKGVKSFEGPFSFQHEGTIKITNFRVDFEPPAPMVQVAPESQTKTLDLMPKEESNNCKCGHSVSEHTDGLCLRGCDPENCLPPEGKEEVQEET